MSWGQHCGDIELAGYLANAAEAVPLVLDLRIALGSSSDPNLNGKLHYPQDIDKSLNETAADKIRKYRDDYNKTCEFIRLLFLQANRETDRFFCSFRSSVSAIKHGSILPLSPRGFLFDD